MRLCDRVCVHVLCERISKPRFVSHVAASGKPDERYDTIRMAEEDQYEIPVVYGGAPAETGQAYANPALTKAPERVGTAAQPTYEAVQNYMAVNGDDEQSYSVIEPNAGDARGPYNAWSGGHGDHNARPGRAAEEPLYAMALSGTNDLNADSAGHYTYVHFSSPDVPYSESSM